jgi:hypothetical protein
VWGSWTLSARPTNAKEENKTFADIGAKAETTDKKPDPAGSFQGVVDREKSRQPKAGLASLGADNRNAPAALQSVVAAANSPSAGTWRKALHNRTRNSFVDAPPPPISTLSDEKALAAQPEDSARAATTIDTGAIARQAIARDDQKHARPPTALSPATAATNKQSDGLLQREMVLLAHARRMVDTRPLTALTLARGEEPKTGLLSEEWDEVYLLALVRLGRVEEARQNAERFSSRYPGSAFNERIKKEIQQHIE